MKLRGSPSALKYPAWVDLKFDGEYTWAVKDVTGKVFLLNKYGLERWDCEATEGLESLVAGTFVMVGELYCDDGKLGKLYDLLGRKKDNGLNFTPFDIIELNGQNMTTLPLIDRLEALAFLVGDYRSPGGIADDVAQARQIVDAWIKDGYEGGVIKELDNPLAFGPSRWAKIKMKDQSDYPLHSIDAVKERIEINNGGVIVGCKCCNKDKQVLIQVDQSTTKNVMIKIEHQGVLKSGSLRHPVYKGIA